MIICPFLQPIIEVEKFRNLHMFPCLFLIFIKKCPPLLCDCMHFWQFGCIDMTVIFVFILKKKHIRDSSQEVPKCRFLFSKHYLIWCIMNISDVCLRSYRNIIMILYGQKVSFHLDILNCVLVTLTGPTSFRLDLGSSKLRSISSNIASIASTLNPSTPCSNQNSNTL